MDRLQLIIVQAAALCGVLVLLNGCAAFVIGGAATVGVAASQERGLKGAATDTVIRAKINNVWLGHSVDMFTSVGLQVNEGRVLLTGKIGNPQARLDAVRLSWQVGGVKEVINEIKILKKGESGTYGRDTWISTQLKARLLFDEDISSINYSIETVGHVIYLMGIAQDQAELDRVTNHARNVEYVRGVVSYVRLKDSPERKGS